MHRREHLSLVLSTPRVIQETSIAYRVVHAHYMENGGVGSHATRVLQTGWLHKLLWVCLCMRNGSVPCLCFQHQISYGIFLSVYLGSFFFIIKSNEHACASMFMCLFVNFVGKFSEENC